MKKQVTLYIDDETYNELVQMMAAKARTLTFIAEELLRQAIREKKRKKRLEKQDNSIQHNSTDVC